MVDRDSNGILRQLLKQWDDVKAELQRLHPSAEVRPQDGRSIFQPTESTIDDVVSFEIRPVVFSLPERASHQSSGLYVVVRGRMCFCRSEFSQASKLITYDCASEVAYFRRKAGSLVHVFGAHYDFDLDHLGHPAFHVQIKSFVEFAEHVRANFGAHTVGTDCVDGMLGAVRVPTAQLDVFSLFVQICADHLISVSSSSEQKAAFSSLLEKSKFCQGAGARSATLCTDEARHCYRARHWYPVVI